MRDTATDALKQLETWMVGLDYREDVYQSLKAFADKKSDGIIQVSTGGGEFASGLNVKDAVLGAIVLAETAHRLAERYDVFVALHTAER